MTVSSCCSPNPAHIPRSSRKDQLIARMIEREFPAYAHQLRTRAERYNACVARAKQYQQEGRLLIVEPCDTMGVDTLAKNKDAIRARSISSVGRTANEFDSG